MNHIEPGHRFWFEVKSYAGLLLLLAAPSTAAALYKQAWVPAAIFAAATLVLFLVRQYATYQALGWYIDANGERQKIRSMNRGRPLYYPTTWAERWAVEGTSKKARREGMVAGTAVLVIAGSLAFMSFVSWNLFWLGLALAWVGALALFGLLLSLGAELMYQTGFQGMTGAKVLDPQPGRPGLDVVMQQKAHGGARTATEDEALDILRPKP